VKLRNEEIVSCTKAPDRPPNRARWTSVRPVSHFSFSGAGRREGQGDGSGFRGRASYASQPPRAVREYDQLIPASLEGHLIRAF